MPTVISKISRIEHVLNQYPTLAGVLGKAYAEYNRNWLGGNAVVVVGMRYVEGLIDRKSGGASIAEWQKIRRFFHTKYLHFLKTPA